MPLLHLKLSMASLLLQSKNQSLQWSESLLPLCSDLAFFLHSASLCIWNCWFPCMEFSHSCYLHGLVLCFLQGFLHMLPNWKSLPWEHLNKRTVPVPLSIYFFLHSFYHQFIYLYLFSPFTPKSKLYFNDIPLWSLTDRKCGFFHYCISSVTS